MWDKSDVGLRSRDLRESEMSQRFLGGQERSSWTLALARARLHSDTVLARLGSVLVSTFSVVAVAQASVGCTGPHDCGNFLFCASSQAEADQLNARAGCDNYYYCPPRDGGAPTDGALLGDVNLLGDGETTDVHAPSDALVDGLAKDSAAVAAEAGDD
jgi:hypothetical protein